MQNHYPALTSIPLEKKGVTIAQPPALLPQSVSLDNPAQDVMTDLMRVRAFTIEPDATIDDASLTMARRSIRLLFVVEGGEVIGLITCTDINSEKPVLFMQTHGINRSDIEVRDIMTSSAQLEAIGIHDVERASVGNIVATMRKAGRQHALVVDSTQGKQIIRGIFSIKQIAAQLGVEINVSEIAKTFAEIESRLLSSG